MLNFNKNLAVALLLCAFSSLIVAAYLYNNHLDLGFHKTINLSDVLGYLTLVSAIFGGVFAYKILIATLDQRDVSYMPFLYVLNIQFSDSGIKINYGNCGQGPAIDVYWEPTSKGFKLNERNSHPEVCRPDHRTGLQREWKDVDVNSFVISMNNFCFDLLCKDQVGNKYQFSYERGNGGITFKGAVKNGRRLLSI